MTRAKRCKGCGLVKVLACFPRSGNGYADARCRPCKAKRKTELYRADPERFRANNRRYWRSTYHGAARLRKLAYLAAYRRRLLLAATEAA